MSTIQVTNINDLSDNAALVTQNGGIKTDKLTGNTTADQVTVNVGSATQYMQAGLNKMWASLDGGSFGLFDSLNVSSATDVAVGDYRFNFTNNFNAAEEYASPMSVSLASSSNPGSYISDADAKTTDVRMFPARSTTGGHVDMGYVSIACIGDLA